MRAISITAAVLLLGLSGCPGETGGGGDTEADDGIDVPTSTTVPDPTNDPPPEETTSGGGGSDSTSDDPPDPSAGETTTGDPPGETGSSDGGVETEGGSGDPALCGGDALQCGNGIDDDGDGYIDLDDPECTGPCDDDESSFQTGLPGDNMDCKQDCFFDGNSGQGDDGCVWDLNCDPLNPGAQFGCPYTGGMSCNNLDGPTEECLMSCLPSVPPGCDCFGCCTVQTDMGPINIFLNSSEDCALDNLGACEECTQSEVCVDPCEPEMCELCFGETELPPGCEETMCEIGTPCEGNADCMIGEFCYLGCCYPNPAG